MMEAAYLAVARFRKPHGLKGEALVFPMTDEPEAVFVPGRVLVPLDDDGRPKGVEVVIDHARPYQRHWLLAFEGINDRSLSESWGALTLGAVQSELRAPEEGEMYLHEIPGSTVVEAGVEIGVVKEVVGVPGGRVLVVEQNGKEHLIPFREPIVQRLDRATRVIEVVLPAGLLEV
jgi:16S rRNA processing protein RimM